METEYGTIVLTIMSTITLAIGLWIIRMITRM